MGFLGEKTFKKALDEMKKQHYNAQTIEETKIMPRRATSSDRLFAKTRFNPYRLGTNLHNAYQRLIDAEAWHNWVSQTQFTADLVPSIVSNRDAAVTIVWQFHHDNHCYTTNRWDAVIRGTRSDPTFPTPTSRPRASLRRRRAPLTFGSAPSYSLDPTPPRMTERVEPVPPQPAESQEIDESLDAVGETFGVEIEMFYPNRFDTESFTQRLKTMTGLDIRSEGYNHGRRTWWKMTTDSSVNGGGDDVRSCELVSPPLTLREMDQITKICDVLETLECRVNRSCGLHVHVKATRNLPFFKALVKSYRNIEIAIDKLMPPSRRGSTSNYCLSLRDSNWNDNTIDRATTVRELHRTCASGGRFCKVNLDAFWRHGTVEFRQHAGTVNAKKISNWVHFCLRLVTLAKNDVILGTTSSVEEMLDNMGTPGPEKQYYITRAQAWAA